MASYPLPTGIEFQLMVSGKPYLSSDPELVAARARARSLEFRFNHTPPEEAATTFQAAGSLRSTVIGRYWRRPGGVRHPWAAGRRSAGRSRCACPWSARSAGRTKTSTETAALRRKRSEGPDAGFTGSPPTGRRLPPRNHQQHGTP